MLGTGLSPPTRGNLHDVYLWIINNGSIPAHAGEPKCLPSSAPVSAVYPRPRGGTMQALIRLSTLSSLSPPTRGNRVPLVRRRLRQGSIPAHAGEPSSAGTSTTTPRVYPRPRGGTAPEFDAGSSTTGLSPPTRGNPIESVGIHNTEGSIPAHAGEPQAQPRTYRLTRVYPRPRGGTAYSQPSGLVPEGLSPPTRGNRLA